MGEPDVQVIYHLSTKTIIRKISEKSRDSAQNKVLVFVGFAQIGACGFNGDIAQISVFIYV